MYDPDPNMYTNEVITMKNIKRCKYMNHDPHLHIDIRAVMSSWYGKEGMFTEKLSKANLLVRHNDTKSGADNYAKWTSEITTIFAGRYSKSVEDGKLFIGM